MRSRKAQHRNSRTMKKTIIPTLILPLVLVPLIAIAEVYKWVDEHGHTHYGEKPPVEDASKIEIKEAPTVDDALKQQSIDQEKLLQIYEEERSLKKEEKLKAEKEKAERKQQCLSLANNLRDLQQGGLSFYDLDEKGERIYLSEAELSAHISKLQKDYDKYCK